MPIRLIIIVSLLAAAPLEARAQSLLEPPRHRQGYYIAAGVAAAIDRNWQDGESVGNSAGQLFSFRMGEMLTRHLGLGLRFDVGATKNGPRSAQLFGLGVEGQWELVENFALRAGIGLGVVSLKDERDKNGKLKGAVSAGYSLGLSYDWFPGSRPSGGGAVTPVVSVRLVPGTDATALVGLVGLEITWWTGLPRNQLQLPEGDAYRR